MIKLYYSPGACSLAPHVALEEAGTTFDLSRVVIADGANRRADYLAINPRGRLPSLDVDGTILTENPAILAYLGQRFPESGIFPLGDLLSVARVVELLSYFSSSVHVAFAQFWRMERFTSDIALHDAVREGGRQALLGYFNEIEALVAAREWLVGDRFSAADTYPFIFGRWGRRIGINMNCYPSWGRHTARVLERPAVQRALAQEGVDVADFTRVTA